MHERLQPDSQHEQRQPFSEPKQGLKRLFDDLLAYIQTPDSDKLLERIGKASPQKKEEQEVERPSLTLHEERALRFIQREQAKGRFPTVREVAKATGMRSSRTGAKLVNTLFDKGAVER